MLVWLASYPRSGNTFLRVLLKHAFGLPSYSIYGDPLDIAADERTAELVGHRPLPEGWSATHALEDEAPWFVKTHGPPTDDAKAIYLIRDGRAAVVSYHQWMQSYSSERWELASIIQGAAFGGSWSDHERRWRPTVRDNTLLLRFEDLVTDPEGALLDISHFVSREPQATPLPSFGELQAVNPRFFRQGMKRNWSEALAEPLHTLFWMHHHEIMERHGYVNDLPEAFRSPRSETEVPLIRAACVGVEHLRRDYERKRAEVERPGYETGAQGQKLHDQIDGRIEALRDELSVRQERLRHELSSRLDAVLEQVTTTSTLSRQLSEVDKFKGQFRQRLGELEADNRRTKIELAAVTAELESRTEAFRQAERKLNERNQMLEEAEGSLKAAEDRARSDTAEIRRQSAAIADLSSAKLAAEQEARLAQDELRRLHVESERAESALDRHLDEEKAARTQAEEEVARLEQELEWSRITLSELNEQVRGLAEQNQSVNQRLQTVAAKLSDAQALIAKLSTAKYSARRLAAIGLRKVRLFDAAKQLEIRLRRMIHKARQPALEQVSKASSDATHSTGAPASPAVAQAMRPNVSAASVAEEAGSIEAEAQASAAPPPVTAAVTEGGGVDREWDVVVTHIEVNDRHGVGVLLRRLFGGHSHLISIRSQDHFGGDEAFAPRSLRLSSEGLPRDAVFQRVIDTIGDIPIRRIICVPYYPDDVRNAIAIREIYGASLCTYLMDDQNVCHDGIPDGLMAELLQKSRLRLAISPELAQAYGSKYGYRFWWLPPAVPTDHILEEGPAAVSQSPWPRSGVMLGNIWGQRWLDLLRTTLKDSGTSVVWHCNAHHLHYLTGESEALAKDGIHIHDGPPLPDGPLVEVLRRSSFAVVPTGSLDDQDDRAFIARLSLPSRIPFILACANTPIIVVGHEETGAARFVRHWEVGTTCPYDPKAFLHAVDWITQPDVNQRLRTNAAARARLFDARGVAEWIYQSLARGEPIDRRYESLMPASPPNLTSLVRAEAVAGATSSGSW